ncbi:OLC1v1016862C4 [Oldenlandia corymbosa var. corymbosa]|uniref:OLC1v1016862C4 n=1 Tax=Oldenlandia corymbosa var. corymbosa TaxID=529605 RepID=A0AAV1E852_OLDCO|nr:OLC1v1016862C4 [Oldenlandia corymbosa var. corymbosa]
MYSRESIVQDALDELQSISQKFSDLFPDWELNRLRQLLEWGRWFYLWGRKWGDEQDVGWETAVCTVEDTLHRHSLEILFLCLTLKEKLLRVDDSDERWDADSEGWYDVLKNFLWRIIGSVKPGIEELVRIMGTDLTLQTRSSSRTDVKQLLDSVDFILHTFQSLESHTLHETVTFMKNFIRFATLHGLEDRQIIEDLFSHFERVFIQSQVLLFHVCVIQRYLFANSHGELLRKIEPVESRVCEIYVGVLQDVSKFSGSSFHPTKETHALVFRDLVDSLIFLILNLFFRDCIFVDMFHHEMHKVHEGLSFLRTTLSEHHDKLDDLIRPLICEAGILIFHLYQENGEQRGRLIAKLELLFSNFETKPQILKAAEEDAPRFPPTSAYPQTNLLGFIDSVLEKIKSFVIQVSSEKDKFRALHDDLTVLRSFVVHDNGMTIQDLSSRIATVAYDTEFVLDSLVVAGKPLRTSLIVQLDVIITEIELIKTQVSEIPWSMEPTIAVQKISQANLKMALAVGKIPDSNDRVVGLDDEAKIIIDRLTRGTKQLDVVSIVGMAGLGKTSLAKKVYHHSHISHHFQVRSWVTVSQEYNTKSLLIGILSGLDQNSTGEYINMREDDLAERLRKWLKGIRYLMILDDIWDTQVWNSLKMSFPDDDKGSRILLTSRQETIGLEINPHSEPHRLRALNHDESWELFRKKMCFDQSCPSEEVIARAKTIAKSCKGLPLMILIVAGFLANTEPSKWEEVEEMLKTEIIIPSSILNLSDLETLIVYSGGRVLLPDTLWGMKKLRHLEGALEFVLPSEIPVANLENLQTFSTVSFTCSQTMVGVLKKLPNLRTLRCRLDLGGGECTVDFITLNQLESLDITRGRNLFQFRFPQNLKDLYLDSTCLPWSEVSAIGRLPNLEALRLDGNEYEGENWDIEEEGTFPKLRVLELCYIPSLERWTTASDDDFPSIETLILAACNRLKEIPSCIAQSSTLQMIEVLDCPRVYDSVKEIHETQMDYGNEDLRIYLDKEQLTKDQLHAHPTNSPTNIFILAGQSNMAGRGGVHGGVWDGIVLPECRPNPSILRLSANLTWEEARDPLHKDIDVNKTAGVGPGMPFANGVLNKDPSFGTIGLVPCAVGGTNITEWRRGKFLYNQLVNRASAAVKSGGIIRAMLWFQGESDTKIQEDALSYGRNLETFFTNVRADLRLPSLPIIQVAVTSAEGTLIDTIRQAQLGFKLPNVRCIDAKGLQLKSDDLHLTAESEVQVGKMLADAFFQFYSEQSTTP